MLWVAGLLVALPALSQGTAAAAVVAGPTTAASSSLGSYYKVCSSHWALQLCFDVD